MKTIKVSDLTGAALDWAAAKCEFTQGSEVCIFKNPTWSVPLYIATNDTGIFTYSPSTDWAQGGPIIERERLCADIDSAGVWLSCIKQNYADDSHHMHSGSTPLEAAMRCYVASKLGDTVEVPKELAT